MPPTRIDAHYQALGDFPFQIQTQMIYSKRAEWWFKYTEAQHYLELKLEIAKAHLETQEKLLLKAFHRIPERFLATQLPVYLFRMKAIALKPERLKQLCQEKETHHFLKIDHAFVTHLDNYECRGLSSWF